jgi:PAS domain S-box-containing protein
MALARIRSCLAANTSNPPVELRLVRSDGSQVDVESVSSPFDYRGQQAAHIVMRDISSRRVAERAFRSQYEFSEKLIQTAQFIILVLDPAGKVLRINPYMEAICGYTNEDVAGRDWFDMFVPEPLRESIRSLFLAAISDIETKGNVTPVIDHQGKERLIEWYDKTLKDNNGNVLGLLATGQDITERLALEQTQSQAAKRMALLSRHLMDVQEVTRRRLASELHDRTSPNLAAIGINIDVAAMALKTRNWEEVAMRMGDNRALLEDTTASIREICSDLRPPALDYAGLAPAIESYATQFSKRTSIRVQLDLSLAQRRLPLNLETTFFRIFQESLTNTAKHARASEILVSLNLDADPWCMTVSDNGIGFDPLAPYVDAGLGMINMREMTEFVGGRFVLDTTPGGGTRIDVQIPRQ